MNDIIDICLNVFIGVLMIVSLFGLAFEAFHEHHRRRRRHYADEWRFNRLRKD